VKAFFAATAASNGVTVSANPSYLSERSVPDRDHYVWTYHIRIENGRDTPVQLLSRHWIITDGTGHVHEVRGDGVIGVQPIIAPGDSYDYVSACPLETPMGTMTGSYQMIGAQGERFDAVIPLFLLTSPAAVGSRN
jgi:ApaG protein